MHHRFHAISEIFFTLRLVRFRNCFNEPEDMYSVMNMTCGNVNNIWRTSIDRKLQILFIYICRNYTACADVARNACRRRARPPEARDEGHGRIAIRRVRKARADLPSSAAVRRVIFFIAIIARVSAMAARSYYRPERESSGYYYHGFSPCRRAPETTTRPPLFSKII